MFYQNQHFGISEYFHKETGENFSFPAHIHHSFELITILEGKMTVKVDDATYDICKGEGVLIFPEQIHSLVSEESKHMVIIFSADIVRAFSVKHSSDLPKSNMIKVSKELLSQLSSLEKESSVIKIKGALYSLCARLDESCEYEKRRKGRGGLLYEIFDFVEKNYDKECTLSSLSSSLGYNRSYLSRYFGEATNMSFITYVNRYKIGKACYLLRNSDKTVLECALECGYSSLRSFNRNFKVTVGSSPMTYRSQIKA